MGRVAFGLKRARFRAAVSAFFWGSAALAQVPLLTPAEQPVEAPAAAPPAPSAAAAPAAPSSAAAPAAPTPITTPAPPPAPPPLSPAPSQPPPHPPSFLHGGPTSATPEAVPVRAHRETSEEFLERASPWVDFTFTSFWHEDRASNFLNLGVQVGGYFFERLRLSARLVTPLESVSDDYSNYQNGQQGSSSRSYVSHDSRSLSALYGVSAGLLVSNSRTFVFGPGVLFLRGDVGAYGNAVEVLLPFEWTTRKNLRVAFELALGRAFGGTVTQTCVSFVTSPTPCGTTHIDRPGGTAVLLQYSMGWSLGGL